MKRKSRFRPLLAGVALALALQPAAAGWGTAKEAKAAAAKEWRDVGTFGAQSATQDAMLAFAEGSLWFARTSAERLFVDRMEHGVWTRESEDDHVAEGMSEFDLEVAPGVRPSVAYYDKYSREIVVRQQQAGGKAWSAVGSPLPSIGPGSKPTIASDSSGRIWLAVSNSNNGGRATVSALENGAWSGLEVVSGGDAYMPAIAVDAQEQPAVAFFDVAGGFYNPIVKSRSASGEWRDIGSLDPWGFYTDLQAASDGSLYLYYNSGNGTNNQNIVWHRNVAGDWSRIGQFPGYYGKMAIDPTDGHPVLAYRETYDPGGWLHAIKWDGTSWSEIGSLGIRDYAYVRLMPVAVGDDGTPYLSYTDAEGNFHVAAYADWTPPTLEETLPVYGEENFDPRDNLQLTFSRPVTGVAGKTISVCDLHDQCDDIDATGDRVTINGATVEIRPDGQWPEGATLSVAIEAGAFLDANGSPYAGLSAGDWRFTLKVLPKSPGAPSVAANPLDGGAEVTVVPGVDGAWSVTKYRVLVYDARAEKVKELEADADPEQPMKMVVEGLENGKAYLFGARTQNANGWSAESERTDPVIPRGKPLPPRQVAATAGFESATVTFESPENDGGSEIDLYRVRLVKDGIEVATADLPADQLTYSWEQLEKEAEYAVQVAAGNAQGLSDFASATVVPYGAPDTPTGVTAAAGDGKATVTFSAPVRDGGLPIQGYAVTAWAGDVEVKTLASEGESTTVTVDGLTNGTAYTFTVKALNAKGESEASAPSNEATPSAPDTTTVPDAPTGVSAAAGDGRATVTFAAPANDGGLPIQGYAVTAWVGDAAAKTIESEGESTTVTVDGLTNGTAYTFTVKALNAKGESEASAPSAPVTPAAGTGGDPGSGSNPGPGPGSGGGSGAGTPPPTDPGQAYATAKAGSLALGTLPVRLEKNARGELVQTLTVSDDWVREAIAKLRAAGLASLDIALNDKPAQPDLRVVRLSAAASTLLADAGIALGILAPEVGVKMPSASLRGATAPIEWELRPLRGDAAGRSLAARAAASPDVVAAAGKGTVRAIGAPVDIRTTLQGRAIEVTLPLGPLGPSGLTGLPRDTGVYIEHGDGKTELVQGRIAALGDQSAIAFDVDRFSTFGIVEIAGWSDAAGQTVHDTGTAYMSGYPGGTFKPNAGVNRAEMAVMLTRLLGAEDPGASAGFRDVAPSHWAVSGISAAAARGWMKGYPDSSFRPDAKLTRAEMAALLAALAPRQGEAPDQTDRPPFSDIRGHWAEAAILQAQRNGYLKGYADGTFQPDRILTRAEAAAILNQLVGRAPAPSDRPRYTDVPSGHWAYGAIQAASRSE
ncbi:fibronectin type III domain-containing protein [Cohnella nanjingensis]|uniref:Fibronectin type III domain-containing protein n=1 Tax=Cohnella nanjingensis TaxID=1387779 RepID=A0A7X0VGL9_9BACL|nr:fibronectin type III domain-containing protein [Cohnella nanjingensis]MBB6673255.1 fibronectin type III domain-containing protein [Cohnella nanjingensis]